MILFSRNFAYAKFRENKTLAKISEITVYQPSFITKMKRHTSCLTGLQFNVRTCKCIVLGTFHCSRGLCVGLCFGMHYFLSFSSFAIILTRKRQLAALLLSSFGCLATVNCKCPVALHHDVMGLYAVCDCGIS